MSLQLQIPDEAVLRHKVKTVIANSLPKIIAKTAVTREKLVSYRKRVIWYLLAFIVLTIFVFWQDFISWEVATIPMIVLLIVINYFGRLWFMSQATLTVELNSVLSVLLTDIFGQPFTWQVSAMHDLETKTLFQESGLMVEAIDSLKVDDLYACLTPYPISFRELYATRQERNGKTSTTVIVFQGLFVILTLPKTLQAKTFISTEGDSSGFAHASFWNKIIGKSDIEETKLEWNDFEKDLHVASSDGAEARYILTTDFMERLYTWWKEGKENIRIKFSGNQMELLLPDRKVKTSFSTASADPEKLEEYFFTMAKPLWRTLTLAEQIKL